MKIISPTLLLVVLLLSSREDLHAQSQSGDPDVAFPVFPAKSVEVHGQLASSIEEYLSVHVQYPQDALKKRLSGTEVIQFIVSPTGELDSFRVMNSVSPMFDSEVIRVLRTTSGNWIPGSVDGTPVAMLKEVALVCKSTPGYDLVYHAREYQYKGNVQLFIKRDPTRALRYFNQARRLMPYEECVLATCCLCKFEMGDQDGAKNDLVRLMSLYPLKPDMHLALSKGEYYAHLKQNLEQEFRSNY